MKKYILKVGVAVVAPGGVVLLVVDVVVRKSSYWKMRVALKEIV